MYYQGVLVDSDTKVFVIVAAVMAAAYLSFGWVEPLITFGAWLHG